MKLSEPATQRFRDKVYAYYHEHGRPFPWRDPRDPYEILVSEVMLQQTQADRVAGYYLKFLARFPDVRSLARARLATVLKLWQGLGYNRRAKSLHEAARQVVRECGGRVPTDPDALVKLPGVGPYTAAAIAAFAGNQPVVVIETNIRSVYIHEFFPDRERVTDAELVPLIEQTIDLKQPSLWYQALMDYGVMLKRTGINPSRRSAHYVRQSAFKGSNREARGAVLKALVAGPQPPNRLLKHLELERTRAEHAMDQLENEGFIRRRQGRVQLA